jgi:hypothetical protein
MSPQMVHTRRPELRKQQLPPSRFPRCTLFFTYSQHTLNLSKSERDNNTLFHININNINNNNHHHHQTYWLTS